MPHHDITRALAAALMAIGALSPATGALAQPVHDAAVRAQAQTHTSITFTNPLGRSRGPGAGAGLL
jgi:hypothetical protein